jgi:preprotein translocase subunit SecE
MAKNQGAPPSALKNRGAKPAAVPVVAARVPKTATPDAPKKRMNIIEWFANLPKFAAEVRAEGRKTTWTSRKETWITSVMVFIMVVITAVFFLIVDQILGQGMQFLLKLGS